MDYKTMVRIEREGKAIYFFLREGESTETSNIVNVEIYPIENGQNPTQNLEEVEKDKDDN